MSDVLAQTIVRLFDTERFYAEIISQMKRVSDPNIPVAGVCIKDHVELHLNLKAFGEMPIETRVAVLKHECEHILRNHIPRFKEIAPDLWNTSKKDIAEDIIKGMRFKTLNIAADCAINGNMPNLPDWGVFPKNFNLPDGESMEWYFDQFKDNDKAKGMMEFDGHELWSESEGEQEVVKEKIRQMVNKAADKTRNAGQMTSEQELLVSRLNAPSINWREQLKRFVAKSVEVKIESSRKKRNRRYGIMFPGEVKTEDLHIGVAIDTSGSVSDEALTQFMCEIGGIAKFAKVTVVEADSEVKKSYVFKPKEKYTISGRGGTAYQPAFDYFNENEDVDAVIYFGDMDAYDCENIHKPKYPVLWAIVGNQNPPADFGGQIRVKVEKERF
jgi:predicted metal-dependent peptidase